MPTSVIPMLRKPGEANVTPEFRTWTQDGYRLRCRSTLPRTAPHRTVVRERPAAWQVRTAPLQVVIADPNGLVRLGLSAAMRPLDDVEVVGEAADLDELVSRMAEHRPGLAVVDYDLPGLDEHDDLLAPLRDEVSDLKIIVVSEETNDTVVVRTFRAGADGLVVKREAQEMLALAVSAVRKGGTFVDPAVGGILVALVSKGQRSYEGPFGLTVQEQRVAVLLAQGMSNREIATHLGITPGTAKTHVANTVAKLGAHDRYDAAAIVEREGITAPGT